MTKQNGMIAIAAEAKARAAAASHTSGMLANDNRQLLRTSGRQSTVTGFPRRAFLGSVRPKHCEVTFYGMFEWFWPYPNLMLASY